MWFFEMKFGNNNTLGGHFYDREEMYDWISTHFKYYTFVDKFIYLRIWYKEER